MKEDDNKWGAVLTLALTESSRHCFKDASNCVITLDKSEMLKDTTNKNESTVAGIRVQCQNIDWSFLTLTEQLFAASNLEKSFNAVFENYGETKKELTQVTYASEPAKMASLIDSMLGFLWEGRFGYFLGSLDVMEDSHRDDASVSLLRGKNDRMMVALWESKFAKILHNGPYSSLSRASDCQIQMDVVAVGSAA